MKMNVMIDGQTYAVNIEDVRTRPVIATVDGERFEVWPEAESPDPNQTPAPTGGTRDIIAPLPGVIAAILVEQGDEVSYGQELCTLEAMKMKNAIRANRAGCIESIDECGRPGRTQPGLDEICRIRESIDGFFVLIGRDHTGCCKFHLG